MQRRSPVLVIDLLRCVAASAVVAYHLGASAALHSDAPIHRFGQAMPGGGVGWTWAGWVGVEIFFVISGYVIARSGESTPPAAFLRRRTLRLMPAAWICATLTALVLLAGSSRSFGDVASRWASAMLFVPTTAPIDGSYWTLEVEWAFYLLAALALRGGGARAIEAAAVRLGVASGGFLIAAALLPGLAATMAGSPWLPLTLMPHGCFFALGVVVNAAALRGWTRRGVGLAAVFGAAGATEIMLHAHSFAGLAPGIGGAAAPLVLFALAMAAIIAARPLQAPLARHIGAARLAALGLATYPLYLLHQVIGAGLIAAALTAGVPAGVAAVAAGGAILMLAILVSVAIEPLLHDRLAAMLGAARRRDGIATA